MTDDLDRFARRLASFGSRAAADAFLDLVEDLLDALDIDVFNPRLALTVPREPGLLPVNIGQRYVLARRPGGHISAIVAAETWETLADDRPDWPVWHFRPASNEMPGAVPVLVDLPGARELRSDSDLRAAWTEAARSEVRRCDRSGFRRFHSDAYARAVSDAAFRADLLGRVFPGG